MPEFDTVQGAIEAIERGETVIELNNEKLTADDVRPLLEALKDNDKVTELCLWNVKLRDEGAVAIAEILKENSTITSLNLGENDIGVAGAVAIAEILKENSTITSLNLSSNSIGDAGAVAIAESLKENSSITFLTLGGNKIGDGGVEAIARMLQTNSSIKFLYLYGNTCTITGGEALAAALESNEALKFIGLPDGIPDDIEARIRARVTVIEQQYDDFGAMGLQLLNSNFKVRWGRSKLMVVGKGAAGKSSTIRTLMWQVPVEVHDSTIGVDLKLTRTHNWAECEADTADLDEQLAKAQFLTGTRPPAPASTPASSPASASAAAPAPASTPALAVQVAEDEVAESYRANLKVRVQQDGGTTVAEEVSFTVWDYGGQEVFYSLHHLFLTSNGVYVLAFDMRELLPRHERFAPVKAAKVTAEPPDEVKVGLFALPQRRRQAAAAAAAAVEAAEAAATAANAAADAHYRAAMEVYDHLDSVEKALATLRFWLDSIALHAPDADIVLVGTYMDAVSRREDLEAVNEQLRSLNVHWRVDGLRFFPVDNMDRSSEALERAQRLRDVVVGRVKGTDYVKREVPLRWALLQEKMLADKGRDYMELGDVKELALEVCGIEADEVTTKLLPFLHELGVVVHLKATPTLANIVVTRPQWLLDNLSRVICDPRHMETHVDKLREELELPRSRRMDLECWELKGVATRELLEWLWEGRNVDYFVDLMQEMLLGCPHPDGGMLVPSLLPPALDSLNAASFDGPLAYVQFSFLPKGVFQRFVTRMVLLCKYGVVLHAGDIVLADVYADAALMVFNMVEVLLTSDAASKRVLFRFKQSDADAGCVPDRARLVQETFAIIDWVFMKAKMEPRLFLSADGTDGDGACVPLDKLMEAEEQGDDRVRVMSLGNRPLTTASFAYFFQPQHRGPDLAPGDNRFAVEVRLLRQDLAALHEDVNVRLDNVHGKLDGLRALSVEQHRSLQRTVLSVKTAKVPPLWFMTRRETQGAVGALEYASRALETWRTLAQTTFEIRMLCQLTGECMHDEEPVVVHILKANVAKHLRRAAPILKGALMLLKVGSVATKVLGIPIAVPEKIPQCMADLEIPDFLKELAESVGATATASAKEHLGGATEAAGMVADTAARTAERLSGATKVVGQLEKFAETATDALEAAEEVVDAGVEQDDLKVASRRRLERDLAKALENWTALDEGSSPETCNQLLALAKLSDKLSDLGGADLEEKLRDTARLHEVVGKDGAVVWMADTPKAIARAQKLGLVCAGFRLGTGNDADAASATMGPAQPPAPAAGEDEGATVGGGVLSPARRAPDQPPALQASQAQVPAPPAKVPAPQAPAPAPQAPAPAPHAQPLPVQPPSPKRTRLWGRVRNWLRRKLRRRR